MNDIDYQQIIMWVIIVIAAGFLGQFGKSFATYLIERARQKKSHAASGELGVVVNPPTEPVSRAPMSVTADADGKADKKASKALVKLRKKERG
jgi:hypothetical protein